MCRNRLIAFSRWSLNASINVSLSMAGLSWERKGSSLRIIPSSRVASSELSRLSFRVDFQFRSDAKLC